jgi:hypothetical protein
MQLQQFWDPLTKQPIKEPASRTKSLDPYAYSYDRLEKPPAAPAGAGAALKLTDVLPAARIGELMKLQTHMVLASAIQPVKVNAAQQAALKTTEQFDALVLKSLKPNEPAQNKPVTLILEGVEAPVGRRISLRVFLNCKNPSLASPIDDPSYVGTVSPFGQEHSHDPSSPDSKGVSFALDATETLARLGSIGAYKAGAVDVALVVVSPDPKAAGAIVRPGKVALVAPGT